MFSNGQVEYLSDEWRNYLQYESEKRGIGMEQVHAEEVAAKERIRKKAFTAEELEAITKVIQDNKRLLEGDEKYPF